MNSVSFGFKSEKLEKLIFVGSMGEKTNLTISDLKTDVQLSPETFKFTAPKGADVIQVYPSSCLGCVAFQSFL